MEWITNTETIVSLIVSVIAILSFLGIRLNKKRVLKKSEDKIKIENNHIKNEGKNITQIIIKGDVNINTVDEFFKLVERTDKLRKKYPNDSNTGSTFDYIINDVSGSLFNLQGSEPP